MVSGVFAHAVQRIKEDYRYSDEKIGNIFGKSGVRVNSCARLLKLNPKVQEMLDPELPEKQQLNASIMITASPHISFSDRGRTLGCISAWAWKKFARCLSIAPTVTRKKSPRHCSESPMMQKSSGISSNRWYEFLGRSSAKKAKEKFSLAFFSSGFFWMDSKSHRAVRWVADFSMRFLQLTERIDDELEIPGCLTE